MGEFESAFMALTPAKSTFSGGLGRMKRPCSCPAWAAACMFRDGMAMSWKVGTVEVGRGWTSWSVGGMVDEVCQWIDEGERRGEEVSHRTMAPRMSSSDGSETMYAPWTSPGAQRP